MKPNSRLRVRVSILPAIIVCLVVGASGAIGATALPVDALVVPKVLTLKAQYTVPTNASEAHLSDVATFELENYTVDLTNEADGQATVEYILPETLLGFRKSVRLFMFEKYLETRAGVTVPIRKFSGADVVATCSGVWKKMRCEVEFSLVPDLNALEKSLKAVGDSRTADRMEIARRFGSDPIGVSEVVEY